MLQRPKTSASILLSTSERSLFAAKMRAARAVLGWSQTELGKRAGLTQRAVYRLEKAAAQARESTGLRIGEALKGAGVTFEQLPAGGFKMIVRCQIANKERRNASRKK